MPNVGNLTQAAATSAITGAGLVLGTVSKANSSTVASGNVISESPAAGTAVSSGTAVNITVSIGPTGAAPASLQLKLSQRVVGAGGALSVSSVVLDGAGNPIASPPSIDYAIVWSQYSSSGTIPGLNGTQIVTASNTRGSFKLKGTVHGTSVTTTIVFDVVQNSTQSGNAAQLTGLSLAQAKVTQNIESIAAAVQSGSTSTIASLNTAMTSAVGTVNSDQLYLATAYEPDTGFLPLTSQMAVFGYPATTPDYAFATQTGKLRTALQQITTLLNNPTANDATDTSQLQTYVSNLATLQSQIAASTNVPSPYGVSANAVAVDGLLGKDMPALLHALATRVTAELHAVGYASTAGGPAQLYRTIEDGPAAKLALNRLPGAMYAGQRPTAFVLTTLLQLGGQIGELMQQIYGAYFDDVEQTVFILQIDGLLNASLGTSIGVGGLSSGTSHTSFTYNYPNSVLYLGGGVTLAQAQADEVYVVSGPTVDQLSKNFNAAIAGQTIKSVSNLWSWLMQVYSAVQASGKTLAAVHQQPTSVVSTTVAAGGCAYSTYNPCLQMDYTTGFNNVSATGTVHSGPVLFLVRDPNPTQPAYGSAAFTFTW